MYAAIFTAFICNQVPLLPGQLLFPPLPLTLSPIMMSSLFLSPSLSTFLSLSLSKYFVCLWTPKPLNFSASSFPPSLPTSLPPSLPRSHYLHSCQCLLELLPSSLCSLCLSLPISNPPICSVQSLAPTLTPVFFPSTLPLCTVSFKVFR